MFACELLVMGNLQQSCDDLWMGWMKGQAIHLHGQVTSFPTSYAQTHQFS